MKKSTNPRQSPCPQHDQTIFKFHTTAFSFVCGVIIISLMLLLTSCSFAGIFAKRSPDADESSSASGSSSSSASSGESSASTDAPATHPDDAGVATDDGSSTDVNVEQDNPEQHASAADGSTTKNPAAATPKAHKPTKPSANQNQTAMPPTTSTPVNPPTTVAPQNPTTTNPTPPEASEDGNSSSQGSLEATAPGAIGGGSNSDAVGDAQLYPLPPLTDYKNTPSIPVTQPPVDPSPNQNEIPEPG